MWRSCTHLRTQVPQCVRTGREAQRLDFNSSVRVTALWRRMCAVVHLVTAGALPLHCIFGSVVHGSQAACCTDSQPSAHVRMCGVTRWALLHIAVGYGVCSGKGVRLPPEDEVFPPPFPGVTAPTLHFTGNSVLARVVVVLGREDSPRRCC